MPSRKRVTCKAVIERKMPQLPRFVVVPVDVEAVFKTSRTLTVSGTIDGAPLGRRGLKPWGDGRWFLDLPEPVCRRAKVETGDRVVLVLESVDDSAPRELTRLFLDEQALAEAWADLTPGRQRQLAEWVADAKQVETRERRAALVVAQLRRC